MASQPASQARAMPATWLDRAIGFFAPRAGLQRIRARMATSLLARHYEAASVGRRTKGWNRSSADANAAVGLSLSLLRESARDLVRNNGYAESALTTIGDHVVGWGIVAKPSKKNQEAEDLWKAWAETTDCDSDMRNDFYGLQKLVMRTVVESGEVLVRRRLRFPTDGLPIPLQLQVLDPDYIDTLKTGISLPNSGRIIHGIEYDVLGRRAAYWLFPEHPGAQVTVAGADQFTSRRIPAESILHIYKQSRPGQVRGPSWFAPVLLRFKDFDEFEDATLMKQKIAACLAVIVSDLDGTAPALGTADDTQTPPIDSLEPGWIGHMPQGTTVETVQPPTVAEYSDYTQTSLRAIATGLGVTYEDLTGDYSSFNFSSARMSRLRHQARVDDWRWRTLIPQFCNPAWDWAMQAATVMGLRDAPTAEWTPPPMPMIDPAGEGRAHMQNIRSGITTLFEVLRERGMDPEAVLAEYAEGNKRLDDLEIVLDSDARKTSQAGLTQARPAGTVNPEPSVFGGDVTPPAGGANPPADESSGPAGGSPAGQKKPKTKGKAAAA